MHPLLFKNSLDLLENPYDFTYQKKNYFFVDPKKNIFHINEIGVIKNSDGAISVRPHIFCQYYEGMIIKGFWINFENSQDSLITQLIYHLIGLADRLSNSELRTIAIKEAFKELASSENLRIIIERGNKEIVRSVFSEKSICNKSS